MTRTAISPRLAIRTFFSTLNLSMGDREPLGSQNGIFADFRYFHGL